MRFKVYLLRKRGRRLTWREVQNAPFYVGDLITYSVDVSGERYKVLGLRPADPIGECPIRELYEPVLLGFSPLAFRIRGFERVHEAGGYSVVQEWHCEAP